MAKAFLFLLVNPLCWSANQQLGAKLDDGELLPHLEGLATVGRTQCCSSSRHICLLISAKKLVYFKSVSLSPTKNFRI